MATSTKRFGTAGGSMTYAPSAGENRIVSTMKRRAQVGGGVDRIGQYRYNPFIQSQNLDIPTDYRLRNAYKRYFFRTNAIVGASLELHSEFPLSDFSLEHDDPAIEEFLNDMLIEMDFTDLLFQAALEYWLIGEWNWFNFFDDPSNPSCYTGAILLDPDKVTVTSSPFVQGAVKDVMFLTMDPLVKKIADQGAAHPVTGPLFRHLPSDIINAARNNQPLKLSPLQASRVKRGGYFTQRGESAVERVFHLLMYKDKLRSAQWQIADRHIAPTELFMIGEPGDPADQAELEAFREVIAQTYMDVNKCFHPSHECLTRAGWKHYTELTLEDEIATLNRETNALEYQKPSHIHVYDHDGEMIHFAAGYNDVLVTPNHRMWVDEKKIISSSYDTPKNGGKKYVQMKREFRDEWKEVLAKDVKPMSRFRAVVDAWSGSEVPTHIVIGTQAVPLDLYLQFAGFFVAEGSTCISPHSVLRGKKQHVCNNYLVTLGQVSWGKHHDKLAGIMEQMTAYFNFARTNRADGFSDWRVSCQVLHSHLEETFGKYSANKQVPQWIKNLPRRELSLFLETLIDGDGHRVASKSIPNATQAIQIAVTSQVLANDVQEIAFKLGKNPRLYLSDYGAKKKPGERHPSGQRKAGVHSLLYVVYWPEQTLRGCGDFPYVGDYHTWASDRRSVHYKGPVWCVTVPNSSIVTRRNGRISISLNSIVYHHALRYEAVGTQGKLLPFWQEFDAIDNETCAGLLLNKSFIMGDSSTFASDVVRLDILMNRYLIFRKKVEKWLLRSIIAPIMKIHEMYVPESKVKSLALRQQCGKGRPLALPTIRWEKQSLRDEAARMQLLTQLVEKKLVPESMLLRQMNIDPRTAAEKVEQEMERQAERKANMLKRVQAKGHPITPEMAQYLGYGEGGAATPAAPGELPASIDFGGGGGEPGAAAIGNAIGGLGEPNPNQLPEVVPGGQQEGTGPTGAVAGAGSFAQQPAESNIPTGIPVG